MTVEETSPEPEGPGAARAGSEPEALAAENARLYQEARETEGMLSLVAEAADTLLAQPDPAATIAAILELTRPPLPVRPF